MGPTFSTRQPRRRATTSGAVAPARYGCRGKRLLEWPGSPRLAEARCPGGRTAPRQSTPSLDCPRWKRLVWPKLPESRHDKPKLAFHVPQPLDNVDGTYESRSSASGPSFGRRALIVSRHASWNSRWGLSSGLGGLARCRGITHRSNHDKQQHE